MFDKNRRTATQNLANVNFQNLHLVELETVRQSYDLATTCSILVDHDVAFHFLN